MSATREDVLEQALFDVRALIGASAAAQHRRSERERLITTVSRDALLDTARSLIGEATRSIDVVYAHRFRARVADPCLSTRAERELYAAAAGVSVRLLTIPPLLDAAFVRDQCGRPRPVAVRVARMPPLHALVVDDRAAFVATESAAGIKSSVIRVPEVLHAICALFQSVWSDALPAVEKIVLGDSERTALARRILGALHAGVTDEVAARELTISVRTYGRYVAEIMTLLGANSRFQLGVRAAELGLLPPAAPVDAAGRTDRTGGYRI
ncbi:LuxR family transcriptional regulator [Streptomyces sp. NPDC058683]|uniref:LuxR family transcriptional regulator n=1 Tax=Streptomyces sp. NPDC058683 TaxID=3346597 RepID=UPI0036507F96